jgi:hypothetical protein
MALVKEQGVVKVENYTPVVRYATVTVPDILLILEGGFLNFFHYTVNSSTTKPAASFFAGIFNTDMGSGSRNAGPDPYALITVQPQNVQLPNVQLQNFQVAKRPGYQTSFSQNVIGYQTSSLQNI